MPKQTQFFKQTLLSIFVAFACVGYVHAENEFDENFLRQGSQDTPIDISRFNQKNGVIAGQYPADVYVNDNYKGHLTLTFAEQSKQIVLCLTPELKTLLDLQRQAYSTRNLEKVSGDESTQCLSAEAALSQAKVEFDTGLLRLNVNIPQALTIQRPRDYIAPIQWQEGTNAAFVNYDTDYYRSNMKSSYVEQLYLGIRAGANVAGWALRHSGSRYWLRSQDPVLGREKNKSHYERNDTYLQKDFAAIQGLLTLGDFYTNSNITENMALRGLQIASDDRMLPASQRGYAPVVQGVANTNASVTIRQNGAVIYQTTVPAGPFIISDLYPSGSSGDLLVEITEANGQKRQFTVPFASVAPLIRQGQFRYHFAAGRYRNGQEVYPDKAAEVSLQYGLFNNLTLNMGATYHKDYQAGLLGAGFNTPIGAFSADATLARTYFLNSDKTKHGYSLHANYSVNLLSTKTNLTLAAYRYSSENFYTLRDAIWANSNKLVDDENFQYVSNFRPKNQFQISINQNLGEKWGTLYLIGSSYRYWNRATARNEYQLAYSNNWGKLNYQLGFSQAIDKGNGMRDNNVYLSLSLPLGSGNGSLSSTMTHSERINNFQSTFSNSLGNYNQFNYSLSGAMNNQGDRQISGNVNYSGNFAEIRSTVGQDNHQNRQVSLGMSGVVVAHPYGITLGNSVSDNFVIIHAKGGHGALVNSTGQGQTLDYFGNAIVPYSTPYSVNYIGIDPSVLPLNIEFSSTEQQIVPRANSINLVKFNARYNKMILFKLRHVQGTALPMAAEAKDEQGHVVGYIGQGGLLFANDLNKEKGRITVVWGANQADQCHFDYHVKLNKDDTQMKNYDAVCE